MKKRLRSRAEFRRGQDIGYTKIVTDATRPKNATNYNRYGHMPTKTQRTGRRPVIDDLPKLAVEFAEGQDGT